MADKNRAEPPRVFETGTEPEYFVTAMRTEPAGDGNVRVMAYKVVHGRDWHLLYTAIVPGAKLIEMGRQSMIAGADAHNTTQWAIELGCDPTEQ